MQCLVFDFDGTLCDSFERILYHFNANSKHYGYSSVDLSQLERLRNQSFRSLLVEFNMSRLKLPLIIRKVQQDLRADIASLRAFPGMLNVLKELKQKGYRLGILSSNTVKNVESFLKANTIHDFDFIYGGGGIFGKSKEIKKIMKKEKISPANFFYVGDEARDIEACQEVGVQVIAVTWGFNSAHFLRSFKPNALCSETACLVSTFENLAKIQV